MKFRIFFILGLAVAACNSAEGPALNEHQREIARMQAEHTEQLRRDPCLRERKDGSFKHVGFRNCLEFGPQQRMHGVWYTGSEEYGFVPNVTSVPLVRQRGDKVPVGAEYRTFLEIDTKAAMQSIGQPEIERCIRAIAIEFIGRRTTKPGIYYTGEGDHVVVVDKLLRAKLLGRVRTMGMPGYDQECAAPEQAKN